MTIDEAIKHAEEVAEIKEKQVKNGDWEKDSLTERNCIKCASEHRQLAEWLRDYKRLKEQELCDDAISRQAAVDAIQHAFDRETLLNSFVRKVAVDALKTMPSVKPKTGHWVLQPSNKEQGERDFIWWKCSECGQVIYSETEKDRREYHAFCGRCGANMSQKPTGSKDVIWYSKRNYSEIVVEPQESEEA